MRLIVVTFLVVGCGGDRTADLTALKAEACACSDAACLDAVDKKIDTYNGSIGDFSQEEAAILAEFRRCVVHGRKAVANHAAAPAVAPTPTAAPASDAAHPATVPAEVVAAADAGIVPTRPSSVTDAMVTAVDRSVAGLAPLAAAVSASHGKCKQATKALDAVSKARKKLLAQLAGYKLDSDGQAWMTDHNLGKLVALADALVEGAKPCLKDKQFHAALTRYTNGK